jgi:hypothetical protein
MTQYKGLGDPDYDEKVPQTPIVIGSTMFNPGVCIAGLALDDGTEIEGLVHQCSHDWRCFWGNQTRVNATPGAPTPATSS